ncbi:hypothetical protein [Streptomyces sp. TRM68416]|uniref:hypothetical protein n=1 Tax=Streptomyces sp. TRM68416 TaxID=2758412 RepID=UPI0016619869|nr:hypothetical protein [Streptomyces sp. TRM68416]MBD0841433.1 hypothetical protein [Streptomyces sp. TRM68416]
MEALLRRSRWARLLVRAVAVLSLAVLAAAAVVRSTLLDPGFYGQVLEEERAYQRVYDEVLVGPHTAPVVSDLLGRLPVPESAITANVKLVIPPETLRAMGDQQIAELVRYLEGDREHLRLTVDLGPVVANIARLGQVYFADAVASLQQRSEPDFAGFEESLTTVVEQLVAGETSFDGLPSLALSPRQAVAATNALLRLVPAAERAGLRPEVEAALSDGDIGSALAAVAPAAVSDRVQAAAAELLRGVGGRTWVITTELAPSDDVRAQAHQVRSVTRLFEETVEPTALVLAVTSLMLLWSASPPPTSRRLMPLGWTLAAAAVPLALAVAVARVAVGDTPYRPPSSWPPTAARLVDDLQATAVDRLLTTATLAAAILLAAGALLVTVGWARQTRPVLRVSLAPRQGVALAAGVSAVALLGTTLSPAALTGPAPRVCQGSSRLCDLRYDELAQLAAHNAMATTANRFISPLQDPDIVGQLNAGVRVLLLDTHYWEQPSEIADRLATSDFSPQLRRQLTGALKQVNPHRPGLWLCHSVCGAGALELVPTLRQIGSWLRTHSTEIVTLVIQDGISPEDTSDAFEQAGLTDLLYEPDPDPDRPWPTLRDMIDDDRRLVVFAQRADGPAPWYRNFYRYGMETPFAVPSPDRMTCAPQRGGTDKRLFLLNHFVTAGGGRRLYAGTVNSRQEVLERVHECERLRGRPVNFVAVDYATLGDVRGAVDALNAGRAEAGSSVSQVRFST